MLKLLLNNEACVVACVPLGDIVKICQWGSLKITTIKRSTKEAMTSAYRTAIWTNPSIDKTTTKI